MGKPQRVGAVRELPLQGFVVYPDDSRYKQQRLLKLQTFVARFTPSSALE